VITDLRLAVYVILRVVGGGGWWVYVFIGVTASARGLKGLEVHWRWLYSCCNLSVLGVPCPRTGVQFGHRTVRSGALESSDGIVTATGWTVRGSKPSGGEIFRTRPDRPWGPSSLLYNWCRVSFPGVKRPERCVDHPLHLARRLKKGYS
jgi:hypothetical protein